MNYKLLLMSCLCAVYCHVLVSSDESSDDGGFSSPLPYVQYARSEYKNSFNRSLDLDLFFYQGNYYEEGQIQKRVEHCAAKYHAVCAFSSDSDDDFYKNLIVISSSDDESAQRQKSVEQHQAKFSGAVERARTVKRTNRKSNGIDVRGIHLNRVVRYNAATDEVNAFFVLANGPQQPQAYTDQELAARSLWPIQEKQSRGNWCLRVCASWGRYKAE